MQTASQAISQITEVHPRHADAVALVATRGYLASDITSIHLADNGVLLFKSPEDFFAAMFGPSQHDAHVITRRAHLRHAEFMDGAADRRAACEAVIAAEREAIAQQLAATHGYDTGLLRHEYERWKRGSLSTMREAPVRARQLLRALDIAIEHHSIAAELEVWYRQSVLTQTLQGPFYALTINGFRVASSFDVAIDQHDGAKL